jgi:hypothetical protein
MLAHNVSFNKMMCMLTNWHDLNRYPHLTEDDFVNSCPFCRNNCNCKTCLRKNIIKKVCLALQVLYIICFLAVFCLILPCLNMNGLTTDIDFALHLCFSL